MYVICSNLDQEHPKPDRLHLKAWGTQGHAQDSGFTNACRREAWHSGVDGGQQAAKENTPGEVCLGNRDQSYGLREY